MVYSIPGWLATTTNEFAIKCYPLIFWMQWKYLNQIAQEDSYLQENFIGTSTFMTLAVFLSGVIFRWFRSFFQIPYTILKAVFVKGSFSTWIFFWKSEFAVFLDWDGSIRFLISCFFIDFHLHGSWQFFVLPV